MATIDDLKTRLLARFRAVPGVTDEDVATWVIESMIYHGYSDTSDVPEIDTRNRLVKIRNVFDDRANKRG